MESINKWLATTAIGGFVKTLLSFAVAYLIALYTKDQGFHNFSLSDLGTIVAGSALPIVYNFLNPSDERYGVGRPNT